MFSFCITCHIKFDDRILDILALRRIPRRRRVSCSSSNSGAERGPPEAPSPRRSCSLPLRSCRHLSIPQIRMGPLMMWTALWPGWQSSRCVPMPALGGVPVFQAGSLLHAAAEEPSISSFISRHDVGPLLVSCAFTPMSQSGDLKRKGDVQHLMLQMWVLALHHMLLWLGSDSRSGFWNPVLEFLCIPAGQCSI